MTRSLIFITLCAVLLLQPVAGVAESKTSKASNTMSLIFRDVPVTELFEMLSRKERVSIILTRGVTGNVTVNLYDTTLKEAIYTIAEAAGLMVEERGGSYVIIDQKERAARTAPSDLIMRPITVQYSDAKAVAEILGRHSSPGGRVTLLEERKLLIVEDTAENLPRLEKLVREIDREPAQIMIEAKILEITLDTQQQFGVDWSYVFGSNSRGGTRDLSNRNAPGFFYSLINRNIELYLNALSDKGRVNTLATPKLLTLENYEAVTTIGDQLGYRVTTTTETSTNESVKFLETGVILRVTPSVDANGRIAMKIKPEVSSGSVSGNIPSKKTTEVITQLIAEDGQSILIGGLIKNTEGRRRIGIPILGDIPGVGSLFSRTEDIGISTETIVIITPRIVRSLPLAEMQPSLDKVENAQRYMDKRNEELRPPSNDPGTSDALLANQAPALVVEESVSH